ncbi:MAG: site-specific integrase [Clostridiales bacterium]|jgi:integrase|nr:site-specific integrase [Clostridiales bacterium]
MASYTKVSNCWTVRFRVNGVHKRLSGFRTKKEAESAYFLEKNKTTVSSGFTVGELYLLYSDYKKSQVKESTFICRTQALRDYVLPYFKNVKIEKLTVTQVISWKNEIDSKPLKFRSKEKIYLAFVNLLNYGVKFHDIPFNIISKVGNFKNTELKREMLFWTEKEFEQFIQSVDDIIYKALFSTLYLTGARKGEIMALTWRDIDFNGCIINIDKTYTKNTCNGSYRITRPKTNSSVRKVMIPEVLVDLLRVLKNTYIGQVGYSESCFVFGFSRPLPPTTIERMKETYCKISGVKEIRIHDFRHSHVSLLLSKGQDIKLIADRLGHSDVSMTLNVYSHFFPDKQVALMSSLNITLDK